LTRISKDEVDAILLGYEKEKREAKYQKEEERKK
jgi:hypothetical protein